jgi:hypothetical protein
VLVVAPEGYLWTTIARDLRAAGFEVQEVRTGRQALAAARRRPPVAFVAQEGLANGWVAAAAGDPALGSVPTVGVSGPLDPARLRFVPFVVPARWDRVLRPADAHAAGVPSAAVREAIARGKLPPPARRERLGRSLYRAGSILVAVAYAGFVASFATMVLRGAGLPVPAPGMMAAVVIAMAAGNAAGDVGIRLLAGRDPGLRVGTWVLVAFAAALIVLRGIAAISSASP